MNVRQLLVRLTLALALVVVVTVGVGLFLAHGAAMGQIEEELEISAANWAQLVGVLVGEGGRPPGPEALEAALADLDKRSELHARGPGGSELVVGVVDGDSLRFLLARSHDASAPPPAQALASDRSGPLKRALAGGSGVVRGRNHRGARVVAGIHPLPELGAAVAVQRELSEIRAPFWGAGVATALLGCVLLIVSVLFGRRTTEAISTEMQTLQEDRDRLDRRIRLAVDGVGIGFWEVDFQAGSWRYSEQLRKDLGYAEGELAPTVDEWDGRVHPDDRGEVERANTRLRHGEIDHYDVRYRLRAADDSWHWIHSQGIPEEGRPERAVGVHWDITAEVAALERARRQEERLAAILQALPSSSVAILDGELRYTFTSGESAGVDDAPSSGDPVGGSLPPESSEEVRRHYEAVLEGASIDFELDRDDRALLVRATPLHGPVGEVDRILSLTIDITDQKVRERLLHRQRQQLDHIVGSIPGGVVTVVDRDLNVVFTGGGGLTRGGIDPEERVGQSLMEWVAEEDREDVGRHLDRALQGESVRYETRLAGRYRGVSGMVGLEFSVGPLRNAEGRVEGVLILSMDITEDLVAREELKGTRERLQLALEAGGHGIFDYDGRTGTMEVSDTYALLLGEDPATFQETPERWVERIHPDDRTSARRHMEDHLGGAAENFDGEYRTRHASGDWIRVRTVARAVEREEDGRARRVLGTVTDVTEERESSRRRELLSAAVRQSSNVVLITDPEGIIEYVNPEFTRVTGYETDEAVGRPSALLESGHDSPGLAADMWRALDRGESFSAEFTNRRKDGEEYLQQTTISPIFGPDGAVTSYVSIGRDVTREHVLEEQLRQSQKMEALGQLTGGVAHDFNNVLTGILTNAGLARQDIPQQHQDAHEGLREVEEAAQRGANLIRKLMAFSRDEYLELHPMSLSEIAEDLGRFLCRTLPERVVLEVETDGSPALAYLDPVAIQQIVLNLANNARDAMPDGGRLTLRTRTGDGQEGPESILEVADTGIGMDPSVAGRVFEPFFTTRTDGTGLGLAMVYALTDRQNGRVSVDSQPGEGTLFRLSFPATTETPGEITPEPAPDPEVPATTGTILLVEDEGTVRRVARRVLERSGHTVLEAADGEAGLALLRERADEVDLVLTDMVMPGIGGAHLFQLASEEGITVPFVFTSGYADTDLHGGVDVISSQPFLRKPWDAEDLLRIVGNVLSDADR